MTSATVPITDTTAAMIARRRRVRRSRLLLLVEILTPLAIVVALIIWTAGSQLFFFPPLSGILLDFPRTWFVEKFTSDLLPSLGRLCAGLGVAIAVGLPLGLILGRIAWLRALLAPMLEFFRAIPAPALIPLVILLIGIDDSGKVLLIAVVCVWPILLNAIDGSAGIEPTYIETATVYRINRLRLFTRVALPSALPQMIAGIRLAVGLGLVMIVVSEMAAGANGIGFVILVSQRTFALSEMWSGIILLGILGYLFNLALELLERRINAWHFGAREQPE